MSTPEESITSLDRLALRSTLIRAGIAATLWQLPDGTYEPVSAEWVRENWQAWLDARPAELVVWRDAGGKRVRDRPVWLADSCDCDNLALGVMAHADVGNALFAQRTRRPRGGLAFGVLFYTAELRIAGGHAINWFVDHEGNVRFFEPGFGSQVNLTPQERSSTWFGLAA
jgi:hypothetical protein